MGQAHQHAVRQCLKYSSESGKAGGNGEKVNKAAIFGLDRGAIGETNVYLYLQVCMYIWVAVMECRCRRKSIREDEEEGMVNVMSVLLVSVVLILLSRLLQIRGLCRAFCNNIPINYPFGIEDGCGAAQFRRMLNCSGAELFFLTPSGSYKVQRIDYSKKSVEIFDPGMSTCSVLQPHQDFRMTDIQSATIPPSPDTVFALINCSVDSPVLNRYRSSCFNFSGHSCDELYGGCSSFKLFHLLYNTTPPCCFTTYSTIRYMTMNILDCTHYTSVYNADGLQGVAPLDWLYGIKLSYSVPDSGCEPCAKSGGSCGFDVETEMFTCICSSGNTNTTRHCGPAALSSGKRRRSASFLAGFFVFMARSLFLPTY